jgi:DNA-binding GntR family transcriptional regulator
MYGDLRSDHPTIYEALKAELVNCRFRPGEQIMIAELADRLRVSSTPVREALIRLEAESLLDVAPRRGFFAKTLDLNEMIDLVQYQFFLLKSAVEAGNHGGVDECVAPLVPDLAHERAGASTSEGDHASHRHVRQAIWIETMMTRVAALSQNRALVRAVGNVNDRTHYVRTIDLERLDVTVASQRLIEQLWLSLRRADFAETVALLKRDRDDRIERLPAVVKEGLSRACGRTSSSIAPAAPVTPPRIRTCAAAASSPFARAVLAARR